LLDIIRGSIIGILQGILEWIPISSSGNLYLLLYYIGLASPGYDYSIALHLPTAFAGLIYFIHDIMKRKYFKYIIPTLALSYIVGIPLYFTVSQIISSIEYAVPMMIGIFLILTGIFERRGILKESFFEDEVPLRIWLYIGLIQGLSALPGVSRSGITMAYLLYKGFSVRNAFKLSFLIGIPFTGLSGLAITVTSGQLQFISDIELLAAFITAFLSGILTLRIMMNKVASYSFWKVCLLLGLLSFASLIFISP